jgi:small conductance mechanosensitive channel
MNFTRIVTALWLSFGLSFFAFAADAPREAALRGMLATLDTKVSDLRALEQRAEGAAPGDKTALVFRLDERAFDLWRDLLELIEATVQLPEDAPVRLEVLVSVQEYLASAGNSSVARLAALRSSIYRERDELESLTGEQKVSREALINSLEKIRFRYYEALVKIIEVRAELGLSRQAFSPQLRDQLYLHSETLVGQVEFAGGVIDELQSRQQQEVDNADVVAALNGLTQMQSLNLKRLEMMVVLLGRLGVDTASYEEVILRQQSGLSLAAIEGGALPGLLEESWQDWRATAIEQAPEILFKGVIFILILLAFRSLSRLVKRLVQAACDRPDVKITTLLKNVLVSISGGTVTGVGIMVALSQIGISLGPMLAGLGVAGFVIGFALQDTLGNFAAGGMILIYRPYDVDDYVEVAGASGFVKEMSLVSTTIATFDNQTLVVPNSKIWGDVIKNVTAQKVRRVDLTFGIGYGDDIPHAEKILRAIVEENEQVLSRPDAQVHLHELADSSVNFVVRPWVRTEDYWQVYWDITREVKMRFDREGISIPFPQRDVHVHQVQS